MKTRKATSRIRLALLCLIVAFLFPQISQALPSYARQTGLSCINCHTEFPILNDLGRQFKLTGYTMSNNQTDYPPLAAMVEPSFNYTNKGQPGGAAPHFGDNSNLAFTQASIFYAGRLFGPYAETLFGSNVGGFLNKIGTFSQLTYDGVAGRLHMDNTEIRYADTATLFTLPVIYGIYANNNPGMQDPWNSTPAWGFPFSSSSLAPTPGASTLINGSLAQQVVGLGGYAMLSNSFYVDLAGYHTTSAPFQRSMGIAPAGETQIPDIAPYWRFAYTKSMGNQSVEVGVFGLAANTNPGRDNTAGKDHIVDWGVDAEYQASVGKHDLTGLFSWIYERDHWRASQSLGDASNGADHLWSLKATVDYLYDKTYGGAVSYFIDNGSHDPLLYSESAIGSPLSDGVVLQVNYMPFNKNGGPSFWPKSNLKLSVQYVIYNRFDGAHSNYDGAGRNASDNNTLYIEAWLAF